MADRHPMVRALLADQKNQTRRVLRLPKWASTDPSHIEFADTGEAEVICRDTGRLTTNPLAPKIPVRPKRSLKGCANHLISAPHHGANFCCPKDGRIKKENRRYLFRSQRGYSNAAVRQVVNQAANRCVLVERNQSIFVHVSPGFASAFDMPSHLRVPCHGSLGPGRINILSTISGAFSVSLLNQMVGIIFGRGGRRSATIGWASAKNIERTKIASPAEILGFFAPGESCAVDLTYEGDTHRARVSLQQCGRLGAVVDRSARHVAAFIGVSLEPRPYSFISTPNDLAQLSSVEGQRVKKEFVRYPTRVKHDQVSPEVRCFVDDTAFTGVFVDRNEGERTFTRWFKIRKRRRHSKAPFDKNSTRRLLRYLCRNSIAKQEKYQLECELFSLGDMHRCDAGVTSMPPEEFAAAEAMLREVRFELIHIPEFRPGSGPMSAVNSARLWYIDGAPVADLNEAVERLAVPLVLTVEEAEVLAQVPAQWVELHNFRTGLGDTLGRRVGVTLLGLRQKGAVENELRPGDGRSVPFVRRAIESTPILEGPKP